MSLYTTGELAKKCNVSVRTVQYYDERGILVPTELTEGGRRLFSENDVKTLETICFLRDLDISIKDIAEILESDESKDVIELLLSQQEANIQNDIKKKVQQLEKIRAIRKTLESYQEISEKSIHDISTIMESKEELKKLYTKLFMIFIPLEAIEIATFMVGILRKFWIPFIVTMAVIVVVSAITYGYWHKQIGYICPQCHTEFKPNKREAFFANHTPKTRKLTCPCCKKKMWCLELYQKVSVDK